MRKARVVFAVMFSLSLLVFIFFMISPEKATTSSINAPQDHLGPLIEKALRACAYGILALAAIWLASWAVRELIQLRKPFKSPSKVVIPIGEAQKDEEYILVILNEELTQVVANATIRIAATEKQVVAEVLSVRNPGQPNYQVGQKVHLGQEHLLILDQK